LVTPSSFEPALQWKKWSPKRHAEKSATGSEVRVEATAQVRTQCEFDKFDTSETGSRVGFISRLPGASMAAPARAESSNSSSESPA